MERDKIYNTLEQSMRKVKYQPVELQIVQLQNKPWIAVLFESENSTASTEDTYDDQGALYYVVAVVMIYGFSIILMIASFIKKSRHDHGLSKYMEDMDKVRQLERRQQKFKTRMAMQNKGKGSLVNVQNI